MSCVWHSECISCCFTHRVKGRNTKKYEVFSRRLIAQDGKLEQSSESPGAVGVELVMNELRNAIAVDQA